VSIDDPNLDDREDADDWGETRPTFPGTVLAAGVVWIAVGGLGVLNTLVTLGMAGANPPGGGPQAAGQSAGVCCGGLVAIAFLVCGYQTVTGKAKDTRGNAVGSILLGSLQLLIAAAIGFGGLAPGGNRGPNALPQEVLLVVAAVVAFVGMSLITAGVLALAGRTQYLEWRRANAPSSGRRRQEADDF
jgi:hypothetical protein